MNIQLTFALSTIGFALLTGCASSPITTDAQNVKTVDITNGIVDTRVGPFVIPRHHLQVFAHALLLILIPCTQRMFSRY